MLITQGHQARLHCLRRRRAADRDFVFDRDGLIVQRTMCVLDNTIKFMLCELALNKQMKYSCHSSLTSTLGPRINTIQTYYWFALKNTDI